MCTLINCISAHSVKCNLLVTVHTINNRYLFRAMFVLSITGSFSGANLTIQVLHSTLVVSLFKKSEETGEPLSRELHLQCDNCSRENKNRWAEWQREGTSLLAAYNNFLPLAEKTVLIFECGSVYGSDPNRDGVARNSRVRDPVRHAFVLPFS